MLGDSPSLLEDELVMMESIYPDEFQTTKVPVAASTGGESCTVFTMELHPSTAGNLSLRNVCVTLRLELPSDYPEVPPVIILTRSRGFSDIQLANLSLHLKSHAADRVGSPMIYDLVDAIKEYLTNTNFPTTDCPFCLCHIEDGDEFCKTECFHYYHKFCLRRCLEFLQRRRLESPEEVEDSGGLSSCIVCRKKFSQELFLSEAEGTEEPGNLRFVPEHCGESEERAKEQEWRNGIYEKQKLKKGIIQPEPVDKMVITLSHTPEVERSLRAGCEFHICG